MNENRSLCMWRTGTQIFSIVTNAVSNSRHLTAQNYLTCHIAYKNMLVKISCNVVGSNHETSIYLIAIGTSKLHNQLRILPGSSRRSYSWPSEPINEAPCCNTRLMSNCASDSLPFHDVCAFSSEIEKSKQINHKRAIRNCSKYRQESWNQFLQTYKIKHTLEMFCRCYLAWFHQQVAKLALGYK